MSDASQPYPVQIDPLDPLIEHFAYQHDFRERYQHALEQIILLSGEESDREIAASVMTTLATEALSVEEIRKWQEAGRPLPWIDDVVNPVAERVRREVLEALGLPS